MKKIMLGTSDTWSMGQSSDDRPIDPLYYIEDCRISSLKSNLELTQRTGVR